MLLVLALQRPRALGELDVVERAGGEDGELVAKIARRDGAIADELHVDLALHAHAHRQLDAVGLAIGVAREVELGHDARGGEAGVAQHLLGFARIVAHLRNLEAQPVVEDVVELRLRQVLVAVFVIVLRHDRVELVGAAEVDAHHEVDPLRTRLRRKADHGDVRLDGGRGLEVAFVEEVLAHCFGFLGEPLAQIGVGGQELAGAQRQVADDLVVEERPVAPHDDVAHDAHRLDGQVQPHETAAERLDLRGQLAVAEGAQLGVEARLIFLAERRAGGQAEEAQQAIAILGHGALQIDRRQALRRRRGLRRRGRRRLRANDCRWGCRNGDGNDDGGEA